MKDRFDHMYDRQADHWYKEAPTYAVQDPDQVHSTICLCLVKEVAEVLDCINWKLHDRKTRGVQVSRAKLLEELVDVQKYLLILMVHHKILPTEFVKAFDDKSDIVETRASFERACREEQ